MSDSNRLPLLDPLTERELDILRLMSEGLSNREIAAKLVVEVGTVKKHLTHVYSKLGVHSRAQALLRASAILENPAPSLPVTRHNLPTYPLSFVGRDEELREIAALLNDPKVRLVTIAGLGGMGKTRLSVEVARLQSERYDDGVYFIPLLSLTSADDIPVAIAQEMNLRFEGNPRQQLLAYLRDKKPLLILDNFEHLLEGAGVVADILDAARDVKILVTSRSSLNLRGEWVRYLEGISFPEDPTADNIGTYSAVQLFLERVHRVRGDFSLDQERECVIEICRLVHGMPLAIELASTWLKTLRCASVVEGIRRGIDFLSTKERDMDARHRSIRAVFDYSWNLLSDEEQRILRRLSIFRGGFGAAAAEQVAGASVQRLSDLIEKSLLYQNVSGLYEIHDLLRQYLEERLENVATEMMSTRTNMIFAWSSLVKGEFARVRQLAEEMLHDPAQERTIYEEAFGLSLLGVLAGIDEDYARCHQLCEGSLHLLSQKVQGGEPMALVFTHLGLAIASCGQGIYQLAKRHILSALRVASSLSVPAFITICLPVFSIILAHEIEMELAVEVMALAHTHPASTPAWMEDWLLFARLRADLQAELGQETFNMLWERGRSSQLEAVVSDLRRKFEVEAA